MPDLKDWEAIMRVNATGVAMGTKHVIPFIQKAGRGSIVSIASIMAYVGGEGDNPGCHASKGAERALAKSVAVRCGQYGGRVNSIYSGFLPPIRTGGPLPPDLLSKFMKVTPLGRIGAPQDVAAGVLFSASEKPRDRWCRAGD
jgi:NAD(P)-dependent dehydrogenase (short-subunit alcohol dehydrogenase family)